MWLIGCIATPTVAEDANDEEGEEDDGAGVKVLSKKEKEKLKKEREKVIFISFFLLGCMPAHKSRKLFVRLRRRLKQPRRRPLKANQHKRLRPQRNLLQTRRRVKMRMTTTKTQEPERNPTRRKRRRRERRRRNLRPRPLLQQLRRREG